MLADDGGGALPEKKNKKKRRSPLYAQLLPYSNQNIFEFVFDIHILRELELGGGQVTVVTGGGCALSRHHAKARSRFTIEYPR